MGGKREEEGEVSGGETHRYVVWPILQNLVCDYLEVREMTRKWHGQDKEALVREMGQGLVMFLNAYKRLGNIKYERKYDCDKAIQKMQDDSVETYSSL